MPRPATLWDWPLKAVGKNEYQIDEAAMALWIEKGWLVLGEPNEKGRRPVMVPDGA